MCVCLYLSLYIYIYSILYIKPFIFNHASMKLLQIPGIIHDCFFQPFDSG